MSQPKSQVRLTSIEEIRAHANYQRKTAQRLKKEEFKRNIMSMEGHKQKNIERTWRDLLNLIGEEDTP